MARIEPSRQKVPGATPEDGPVEIGAVCRATGLSARTIRYYEEMGLLPGVRRRSGGRRIYGADELERRAQAFALPPEPDGAPRCDRRESTERACGTCVDAFEDLWSARDSQ